LSNRVVESKAKWEVRPAFNKKAKLPREKKKMKTAPSVAIYTLFTLFFRIPFPSPRLSFESLFFLTAALLPPQGAGFPGRKTSSAKARTHGHIRKQRKWERGGGEEGQAKSER
jgi:hypothetical protein